VSFYYLRMPALASALAVRLGPHPKTVYELVRASQST
jgi:hypothetical protein